MKLLQKVKRAFHRKKSDEGFMAAEWVAAVGVLIIPTFIAMVSILQFPPRVSAIETASAEAARAYVEALDSRKAEEQANLAAQAVIVAQLGFDPDEVALAVRVTVDPLPNVLYCQGEVVTITVSLPISISADPFNAGNSIANFGRYESKSSEYIGDYVEIANPVCP